MLHEPFTPFTLPDIASDLPLIHRGGEGGEGFGEGIVCIEKEAKYLFDALEVLS